MNEQDYNEINEIWEASWRGRLTPEEEAEIQAYLAAHPSARGKWEEELALTSVLGEMRDAPLSSNFTARVLEAADLEAKRKARSPGKRVWDWAWRRRLRIPQLGWGLMLVVAGFLATQFSQSGLDADMKVLVEALPPEPRVVLADFDAIQVPVVDMDEDLWAALNE